MNSLFRDLRLSFVAVFFQRCLLGWFYGFRSLYFHSFIPHNIPYCIFIIKSSFKTHCSRITVLLTLSYNVLTKFTLVIFNSSKDFVFSCPSYHVFNACSVQVYYEHNAWIVGRLAAVDWSGLPNSIGLYLPIMFRFQVDTVDTICSLILVLRDLDTNILVAK